MPEIFAIHNQRIMRISIIQHHYRAIWAFACRSIKWWGKQSTDISDDTHYMAAGGIIMILYWCCVIYPDYSPLRLSPLLYHNSPSTRSRSSFEKEKKMLLLVFLDAHEAALLWFPLPSFTEISLNTFGKITIRNSI